MTSSLEPDIQSRSSLVKDRRSNRSCAEFVDIFLGRKGSVKRSVLFVFSVICVVLFLGDLADVYHGVGNRDTPYAKANPMISLLGFCSTQITMLMSTTASLFLLRNAADIRKCAKMLDALLMTFDFLISKEFIARHKRYAQRYVVFLLILGVGRFACNICEPEHHDFAPSNSSQYLWIVMPVGAAALYSETCMLLAMLIYLPVTALFTYFSSLLIESLQAFHCENKVLLGSIDHEVSNADSSAKPSQRQKLSLATDQFVSRLKILRVHHEDLNDTFDQLQLTFGIKLLVDIVGNVLGLLSVIAWFSMWTVNNELASIPNGVWNGMSAFIYLATLWMVGNRPLFLYLKHIEVLDMIERVFFRRQMSYTIENKPSRDEVAITYALRFRMKSKILSFSAGGVLDIHGMAISLVAAVSGFLAFICERVQSFQSHLKTPDVKPILQLPTNSCTPRL